jgi:hypothetical protein
LAVPVGGAAVFEEGGAVLGVGLGLGVGATGAATLTVGAGSGATLAGASGGGGIDGSGGFGAACCSTGGVGALGVFDDAASGGAAGSLLPEPSAMTAPAEPTTKTPALPNISPRLLFFFGISTTCEVAHVPPVPVLTSAVASPCEERG